VLARSARSFARAARCDAARQPARPASAPESVPRGSLPTRATSRSPASTPGTTAGRLGRKSVGPSSNLEAFLPLSSSARFCEQGSHRRCAVRRTGSRQYSPGRASPGGCRLARAAELSGRAKQQDGRGPARYKRLLGPCRHCCLPTQCVPARRDSRRKVLVDTEPAQNPASTGRGLPGLAPDGADATSAVASPTSPAADPLAALGSSKPPARSTTGATSTAAARRVVRNSP
jgi:hypothetical protein